MFDSLREILRVELHGFLRVIARVGDSVEVDTSFMGPLFLCITKTEDEYVHPFVNKLLTDSKAKNVVHARYC